MAMEQPLSPATPQLQSSKPGGSLNECEAIARPGPGSRVITEVDGASTALLCS